MYIKTLTTPTFFNIYFVTYIHRILLLCVCNVCTLFTVFVLTYCVVIKCKHAKTCQEEENTSNPKWKTMDSNYSISAFQLISRLNSSSVTGQLTLNNNFSWQLTDYYTIYKQLSTTIIMRLQLANVMRRLHNVFCKQTMPTSVVWSNWIS